jgi:hypothetical protein
MSAPPRIDRWATDKIPELSRPINDALASLSVRLDNVEGVRLVMLPILEFGTGSGIAAGTNPLPLRVGIPGVTLKGLWVVGCLNLTSSDAVGTTAMWPEWRMVSEGVVEIRYVSGMAVSTRYRLQLMGAV